MKKALLFLQKSKLRLKKTYWYPKIIAAIYEFHILLQFPFSLFFLELQMSVPTKDISPWFRLHLCSGPRTGMGNEMGVEAITTKVQQPASCRPCTVDWRRKAEYVDLGQRIEKAKYIRQKRSKVICSHLHN